MLINHSFKFRSPDTLEAVYELWQNNDKSALLAGGTDVVPLLKYGLKNPVQIIGLGKVPYLSRIENRGNSLFIGSMNRLQTLVENQQVQSHCKILIDACRVVASPQIRNVGTIGGNICQDRRCIYFNQTSFWRKSIAPCFKTGGVVCHQNPRSNKCKAIYHSDLAPALLALNARVECFDKQGKHELPLDSFISQHVENNGGVQSGTLLMCGIIIPKLPVKSWMGFVKQSVRESIDFPVVNTAACYKPAGNNNSRPEINLVVGAVAPEPIRLINTQQLIIKAIEKQNFNRQNWVDVAMAEAREKSQLILDTGLALPARKKGFGIIGRLIEDLVDHLNLQV